MARMVRARSCRVRLAGKPDHVIEAGQVIEIGGGRVHDQVGSGRIVDARAQERFPGCSRLEHDLDRVDLEVADVVLDAGSGEPLHDIGDQRVDDRLIVEHFDDVRRRH